MSGFNFGSSASHSTSPFGPSATSFSFAPSTSLFGSSSAPSTTASSPFGAASSSPFGFSSTPSFGTPSPSPAPNPTPSFGVGSSTASSTTSSPFGFNPFSASAPSPFSSTASPSLFGASSSAQTSGSTAPLFGSSPFGSTASASSSAATTSPLFGSAPASSSPLFGTTGSAFAPTSGSSLFGSSSAPASSTTTPGLFGSAAPSSAASTTHSFPSFSGSSSSAASATPAFAGFSTSSSSAASTAAPAFGKFLSSSSSSAASSTATAPAFPSFSSSIPAFAGFPSASSAAPATSTFASSSSFSSFPSSAPSKSAASTTTTPSFGTPASSASQSPFGVTNTNAASSAAPTSTSLSFSKPSSPLFSTVTTTTASSTPTVSSSTTQSPLSLFSATPSAPPAASTAAPASTAVPASSAAPSSAATTSSFTGFSFAPASSAATTSSSAPGFGSSLATSSSLSIGGSLAASSSAQPSATVPAFGVTTSSTTTTTAATTTTGASTPAQTSTSLAVASTSGTTSTVNGSTTVSTTTPKLPSEITGKTVEEIIKEWNAELQERTGKFRKQANAIADWDRRILQNRDVLLGVEIEVANVVDTQSKMEGQLELIETQQDEVDMALQSIEEEAERIYQDERGLLLNDEAAATRAAMSEQAEYIERELEQLTEQIKSIIETVNANHGGELDVNDGMAPLDVVLKILNNQLSSLMWIDEKLEILVAGGELKPPPSLLKSPSPGFEELDLVCAQPQGDCGGELPVDGVEPETDSLEPELLLRERELRSELEEPEPQVEGSNTPPKEHSESNTGRTEPINSDLCENIDGGTCDPNLTSILCQIFNSTPNERWRDFIITEIEDIVNIMSSPQPLQLIIGRRNEVQKSLEMLRSVIKSYGSGEDRFERFAEHVVKVFDLADKLSKDLRVVEECPEIDTLFIRKLRRNHEECQHAKAAISSELRGLNQELEVLKATEEHIIEAERRAQQLRQKYELVKSCLEEKVTFLVNSAEQQNKLDEEIQRARIEAKEDQLVELERLKNACKAQEEEFRRLINSLKSFGGGSE